MALYRSVDGIARRVDKIYGGVVTDIPVYETTTTKETIPLDTYNKIMEYFNRSSGSGDYYFSAYSSGYFESNNGGVADSTAELWLTAKEDIEISFDYSYSSEANYDKFYLTVAGVTIEDGVSGATTSKNFTGTLLSGQSIYAKYAKDYSTDSYNDKCKLYNFVATVTQEEKVQIGTETYPVAREVTKAYIGVDGVAREYLPGGVKWRKYNCNTTVSYGSPSSTSGSSSITHGYYYDQGRYFYDKYQYVSSSRGYDTDTSGNRTFFTPTKSSTIDEVKSAILNSIYIDDSENIQKVYRITGIDSISDGGGILWVKEQLTLLAYCTKTTSYLKGSTMYGEVSAPLGSLPENGTLSSGSVTGSYCVIKVGSTYYYYERI